jgi:hypothetical protein
VKPESLQPDQFCTSIISDHGIAFREVRDQGHGFLAITVTVRIDRKEIREANDLRAGTIGDASRDDVTVIPPP